MAITTIRPSNQRRRYEDIGAHKQSKTNGMNRVIKRTFLIVISIGKTISASDLESGNPREPN